MCELHHRQHEAILATANGATPFSRPDVPVTTSLTKALLATARWPVVFPRDLVSRAPWTRIHSHRANRSPSLGVSRYRPAGSSNALAPCIGPEMVATTRTRSFAEVGMDEVEDYSCPIPQSNPLCWSASSAFPFKTRHVAPCRGFAIPPRWLAGARPSFSSLHAA